MKYFKKDKEVKPANKIILLEDGQQVLNPTEEMLLANGWEEYVYVAPEPTEAQKLERAINDAIQRIEAYDSSEMVNSFYIGDMQMWLDKATRTGLMLRFQAEQMAGQEQTSLWYGENQFALPLANAMGMLYALELYASKCYDNTQHHIAKVKNLTTIEEVQAYDYTNGYPEKLRF